MPTSFSTTSSQGGPLGGTNLTLEILDLTFGVTAWMAILGLCFLATLLTILPALTRKLLPGFAGIAALLLLASETWAAIDPAWNTGALTFAETVSYRNLLTFGLAALAILKAHQSNWTWLISANARDPLEGEGPASKPTPKKPEEPPADDEDDEEADDEAPAPRKRRKQDAQRKSAAGSPKKAGKKSKKRRKRR